jgi:hypothetical protein
MEASDLNRRKEMERELSQLKRMYEVLSFDNGPEFLKAGFVSWAA